MMWEKKSHRKCYEQKINSNTYKYTSNVANATKEVNEMCADKKKFIVVGISIASTIMAKVFDIVFTVMLLCG